jgi:hypothetical protein
MYMTQKQAPARMPDALAAITTTRTHKNSYKKD